MKKLLSLILAMMMFAVPCLAEGVIGGADGPTALFVSEDMITADAILNDAIAAGRRVTVNVTVPEITGVNTGDPAVDTAIVDFVKALGLRVEAQGDEYDMGLSLTGKDVLTLGWAVNGEDAYIKSNLIGGTIVLSLAEVEPIISRLLDMMVLMEAMTEEEAAEIKAQLPAMIETYKAAFEQGMAGQMTMEDLLAMDFSAFDPVLKDVEASLEPVTEIVVPRMCDQATHGVCLTIDNAEFTGAIRALFQFIKDNPKFMAAMTSEGIGMTEETRAMEWETRGALYQQYGIYENYEAFCAENPTTAELLDQLIEETKTMKMLDGDFVTTVYFNDAEEIVYMTSTLPMFTETESVIETEENAETVNGTTEILNVVYTRQTVAQGVSHVCNIDVDGEGITVDVLAKEKAWVINLSDNETQEVGLTINAVEENGVIKGDFDMYENGPVGTFSYYHMADETQFKTEIAFALWLDEEYLAGHPNEEPVSLSIAYTCDYDRSGVDFSGKEIVNVAFNDVKVVVDIDIATADPVDSIMAGNVVRPAELDDAAFANWFVTAYNAITGWVGTTLMALPASVLTLMTSGMY